jgi:uncharacterized phage infection (PIP) family protein YhgE
MTRFALALLMTLMVTNPAVGWAEPSSTRQTLDAVILVADRFEAADSIEAWVSAAGGYLVSRLEDRLVLRVPSPALDQFVDFLESSAEEIVQIQQRAEDIGQSLLEAEAGIRSKQELFERALTLIDQSDLSTTLEIESEILSILSDMEALKGSYRKLLTEGQLARVQVDFKLQEERLPTGLPSAFPWINTVDFYRLMGQFEHG